MHHTVIFILRTCILATISLKVLKLCETQLSEIILHLLVGFQCWRVSLWGQGKSKNIFSTVCIIRWVILYRIPSNSTFSCNALAYFQNEREHVFCDCNRSEILSVVTRPTNQLKITFLQVIRLSMTFIIHMHSSPPNYISRA